MLPKAQEPSSNIFITGFSGSGKTAVGREVARRLGWRFVDLDEKIVEVAGMPIEAIFAQQGEPHFRELEHDSLKRACGDERQVVSTGGGVPSDERNRRLMDESGVVVCLEARPETIRERLEAGRRADHGPVVRPMLEGPDQVGRIVSLKSRRQPDYAMADWTVHTDDLTPQGAADEVVRAWQVLSQRPRVGVEVTKRDLAATVRTSSGAYPVWVGWGILDEVGERAKTVVSPQAAYVITDEGAKRHARRAQVALEAAGVPADMFILPPGERSKTLQSVQHIYGWLAGRRAERGHLVLAVGGGVVGDVAGFVGATFLRGMLFAQAPTTSLAMMDAAIGGKTGVDLAEGKNLVGAFYQPSFVLGDVQTLQTLPERQLNSGWAEAIKHGLVLDEGLLRTFEEQGEKIRSLDQKTSTEVIMRSGAVKVDVVSRDERDSLGIRVLLNYGHTIGHAIEAATGYGRFLHGEAVSIGMMGAAMIGNDLGMLSAEGVERQRDVLRAFGLPVSSGDIDMASVEDAMLADKKASGGAIEWVLLETIGHAVTRNDVPPDLVRDVLRRLGKPVPGKD